MSRVNEIIAIMHAVRYCTEYGCEKCIARWNRRKKWQSRKNPARRATGRK
jgi:hypothetical protein